MNTLGLRSPSGTGEVVFLIGPATAEIVDVLSVSISDEVSSDVSSMVPTVDLTDVLTTSLSSAELTSEICK